MRAARHASDATQPRSRVNPSMKDVTVLSWFSLTADQALLVQFFLPFIIAFMASFLIYGWMWSAGIQSGSFSPGVAAVLSTPIFAFLYHSLFTIAHVTINTPKNSALRVALSAIFFAPTYIILPPLLILYLRGFFHQGRVYVVRVWLCTATCICQTLQALWLYTLFTHTS